MRLLPLRHGFDADGRRVRRKRPARLPRLQQHPRLLQPVTGDVRRLASVHVERPMGGNFVTRIGIALNWKLTLLTTLTI